MFARPAIHASCGERGKRAHSESLDFALRALAARKMRREQKSLCRCAARETAISAARSMDQASNLQVAGPSGLCVKLAQWLVSALRDMAAM
jgi:hypothetical protein